MEYSENTYIPLLEARNITKEFATQNEILKGVSLKINSGDFVSILGASGSGKSTLLTILAGIDKATTGDVLLNGKSLTKATENELAKLRRTKIGYVFQFFNLVPYLSIKENILLPLILDGRVSSTTKEDADELMKKLGIFQYANRLPSKLSGGEQQRVAIARGIVFKPKILFLDEPTGSLDSKTGENIMRLLNDINKELGTTIVQVTHNKDYTKTSNRVIYLKDGLIVDEISS